MEIKTRASFAVYLINPTKVDAVVTITTANGSLTEDLNEAECRSLMEGAAHALSITNSDVRLDASPYTPADGAHVVEWCGVEFAIPAATIAAIRGSDPRIEEALMLIDEAIEEAGDGARLAEHMERIAAILSRGAV